MAAEADLANSRRLLFEDRLSEAMACIEELLAGELSPRDRVAALILRLIALINMGRSAEFSSAAGRGVGGRAHRTRSGSVR